jgi:hypothetical protein
MAVPITTIQGSDNVALSRLTINANFSALKSASDAVTALLNPTTYTLSGVKSVQIDDAAVSLSSSILSVSKGATILGNLTLGTLASATSVLINGTGGVTIAEGSLSLGATTSTLSAGGNLTVGGSSLFSGMIRKPGISNAEAFMLGTTGPSTITVSPSNPNYTKYVFLTNGATGSTAGMTASIAPGATGQVLEIYHVLGPAGGVVNIDTTSNFGVGGTGVGLTGPITMTRNGDVVKLVYEGGWYLWEAIPSTVYGATGSGATAPTSISYTRI